MSENSPPTEMPWRFQPGQSGNPGGRPKGIAAKAREHTNRAVEVLVAALDDQDGRTRIAAAKELLDRGHGKAIAMTADVTNRLDDMDDDDLIAALDTVRAALHARVADDDGVGAQTAH